MPGDHGVDQTDRGRAEGYRDIQRIFEWRDAIRGGERTLRPLAGVPAAVSFGLPDGYGGDGRPCALLFEDPAGDVLGGRGTVHDVVEVGVVRQEFVQDGFEVREVAEHADLVELGPLELGFDMVAVAVEPRAFPFVAGDVVRRFEPCSDDECVHLC